MSVPRSLCPERTDPCEVLSIGSSGYHATSTHILCAAMIQELRFGKKYHRQSHQPHRHCIVPDQVCRLQGVGHSEPF